MLLPRTHVWTPRQQWLIIVVVATALLSFGTLVYSYERDHRGPSETVLFGTWKGPLFGEIYVFKFDPDQTFSLLTLSSAPGREEEVTYILKGRWYAGGSNIYLRVTETTEDPEALRPIILHIIDIETNELRVRLGRDVISFKRVDLDSPPASNKSPLPTSRQRDDQI